MTPKLFSIFLLVFILGCTTLNKESEERHFPAVEHLQGELERFVEITKPNRTVGTKGHEAAFQYIRAQFEAIAKKSKYSKVLVHEFHPDVKFAVESYQRDFETLVKNRFPPNDPQYKKWEGFTKHAVDFVRRYEKVKGRNIILEVRGIRDPEEVVYVGAHYDTMTHDKDTLKFTPEDIAPGADDNASALMVMLAAARDLASRPHDKTIRFVAPDYEEIFFLGSYALAKDLSSRSFAGMDPNEKVVGLFALEMVGWSRKPIETRPVVKLYTRTAASPGMDLDMRLAQTFQKGVYLRKASIDPVIMQNSFNRSDNWPFWIWSFPAVCISQDWEKDFNSKNYHTPNDLPETLNYPYLREIMIGTIEGVDQISRHSLAP